MHYIRPNFNFTSSFNSTMSSPLTLGRHIQSSSSISELLSKTTWHLPSPSTQIHTVSISPHSFRRVTEAEEREVVSPGWSRFHVVRDDLLHPLANGNKSRKLDALLPLMRQCSTTDVVTCGGCQSAHTAALAVYCAELGIKPHLLLRGEQPKILTGYNLVSLMFGNVTYNSRSVYAQRRKMLYDHAVRVAGNNGLVRWDDEVINGEGFDWREMESDSRRVVIVNEGASSVLALLGLIRLVKFLSESPQFGDQYRVHIIVDSGTGTTAVGLALGVFLLGLSWKVTAVMLADKIESYKERESSLISEFKKAYQLDFLPVPTSSYCLEEILSWVERSQPRKFGKVLNGEIERCREIAQQTGILLDPIYTLAAWNESVSLSLDESEDTKVLMIHTGGTLGMFGLAQRYTSSFDFARDTDMGL